MRVSLEWLRELVSTDRDARAIADLLVRLGLEVSAIEELGAGLGNVVVAHLLSVAPHPNADRLTLCEVDTGDRTHRIVCGAKNMKPGDRVALALPGAKLPNGVEIRKSKIRGEISEGMLCSEVELALSAESAGILILPPDAPVGTSLAEYLGRDGTILEIDLTPNRGDCLSHLGVAREVAAATGAPLRVPPVAVPEEGEATDAITSVTIEDDERCPRYAARVIRGVRIGPSPRRLAARLEKVGVRPINNVVDVTNAVLFELGQPLHAFDLATLRGQCIVVRRARAGEKLMTLDGVERALSEDDLAICDAERPVALAGIMGGRETEVTERTTDVLLESAYFEPAGVRRTAKRHGLQTEASYRFERGCDPEMVARAADRAAALIAELAGGRVAPEILDVYPCRVRRDEIRLDPDRANALLGLSLSPAAMADILRRLRIQDVSSERTLRVKPPSWRPDLTLEVDLIEEIARLHGYDRIPTTLPAARMQVIESPPERRVEMAARQALTSLGFHEAITYRFVSAAWPDRLLLAAEDPRRRAVFLRNPLREDQAVMRTSLAPGLLLAAHHNLRRDQTRVRLFEVGRVFFAGNPAQQAGASSGPGAGLPEERTEVAALLVGEGVPGLWGGGTPADFYDAKGAMEAVLDRVGVQEVSFVAGESSPYLHPGACAQVLWEKGRLGEVGRIHPEVAAALDLPENLYLLELVVADLLRAADARTPVLRPLPRLPTARRDLAIVTDGTIEAGRVIEAIRSVPDGGLQATLRDIEIFDVYQGEGIAEGKRSLALHLFYRSDDRTLTDAEVNVFQEKVIARLTEVLGACLRTK
jgi:phenylalanyl-tRNA synthetase beta chain